MVLSVLGALIRASNVQNDDSRLRPAYLRSSPIACGHVGGVSPRDHGAKPGPLATRL